MRQRITRRLRAAKHRLQQLPELYEAYALMRFPFHQLKEDVAAYERAVNMYTNHVDEIINENRLPWFIGKDAALRTRLHQLTQSNRRPCQRRRQEYRNDSRRY